PSARSAKNSGSHSLIFQRVITGLFPEFFCVIWAGRRRTLRRLARGRMMTVSSELLKQLNALPDWAVLTDQQTSQLLGLSVDTLRRLDRDCDGPPWVKLSPRRRGRPVGGLRKWIERRVGACKLRSSQQARETAP